MRAVFGEFQSDTAGCTGHYGKFVYRDCCSSVLDANKFDNRALRAIVPVWTGADYFAAAGTLRRGAELNPRKCRPWTLWFKQSDVKAAVPDTTAPRLPVPC